ncbi:MAG TPA: fasciclin [Cyanobacteria bacterium UBA8530]|nr:fasciclin [Cyanobacteria bacterium UBA8530]
MKSSFAPVLLAVLISASFSLAAEAVTKKTGDIPMVLKEHPSFRKLTMAIDSAGLTSMLRNKGPFTLFAPTDAAFAKIPKKDLIELRKPENKSKLAELLSNHVVKGMHLAADLKKVKSLRSLEGKAFSIKNLKGFVQIESATVVMPDIKASNGVIQGIDTVLRPK